MVSKVNYVMISKVSQVYHLHFSMVFERIMVVDVGLASGECRCVFLSAQSGHLDCLVMVWIGIAMLIG